MEYSRLQSMNSKLSALNKLLVEENELSTRKISQLTVENMLLRQQVAKLESMVQKPGAAGLSAASEHRGAAAGAAAAGMDFPGTIPGLSGLVRSSY